MYIAFGKVDFVSKVPVFSMYIEDLTIHISKLSALDSIRVSPWIHMWDKRQFYFITFYTYVLYIAYYLW